MTENNSSFRAVIEMTRGGHCVMTGFPGLQTGIDGDPYLDPDNLSDTLADVKKAGAGLLIVLAEEAELPDGAFAFLHDGADAAGIDLAFLPIPDYETPDAAMLDRLHDLETRRPDMPNSGGTVAFACQYGAGRSGTMVAYLLLREGYDLDAAIKRVRAGFGEAIESEAQLTWLAECCTSA